jgi:hypothetical protein
MGIEAPAIKGEYLTFHIVDNDVPSVASQPCTSCTNDCYTPALLSPSYPHYHFHPAPSQHRHQLPSPATVPDPSSTPAHTTTKCNTQGH